MEESLKIRRFNGISSPEEFACQFERKNVTAVFTGCVKDWKAFSKSNISNGGLFGWQREILTGSNASMPSITIVNDMIGASDQCGNENAGHNGHCDKDLDLSHEKGGGKGKLEQGFSLHELEPHALRSLHELVSIVHHHINRNQTAGNISADQSFSGQEDDAKEIAKTDLFNLEEDLIANIVWNLQPRDFQSVFLNMAHNFPGILEALVLHTLSPVGVEVLTRKFEQMDQMIGPDDCVFDNQSFAMYALMKGKESFACQAFDNVLAQYLRVNLDGPKSSLE